MFVPCIVECFGNSNTVFFQQIGKDTLVFSENKIFNSYKEYDDSGYDKQYDLSQIKQYYNSEYKYCFMSLEVLEVITLVERSILLNKHKEVLMIVNSFPKKKQDLFNFIDNFSRDFRTKPYSDLSDLLDEIFDFIVYSD
jgi:hypothetical protein